ncbi:ogr/Delta-like zinc finger family protein [Pectobacterium aroidearum]|uniref:ogr/Delta-like zinc finger family protein n=1 Tax=Pectobacterium aroidearum TaxID=1201031 RepID=UPI0030172FB9
MRNVLVYCPECGAAAKVRKTNRKHAKIADLYCACSSVECGHTFVLNLIFSHTLSPSAITYGSLIKGVIDGIAPNKRQDMIDMLKLAQEDAKKEVKKPEPENTVVSIRRKIVSG